MPAQSPLVRRSLAAEDRDIAIDIGRRLRLAGLDAHLTQLAVASPRYTKAYVSALENGLPKPSVAALFWIARRLGVRPGDLLDGID